MSAVYESLANTNIETASTEDKANILMAASVETKNATEIASMTDDEKTAHEAEKAAKKEKQLEVLGSIANSTEPVGPDETKDILDTFTNATEATPEEKEVQKAFKEKAANDLLEKAATGDIDPSDADDAAESLFNAPKEDVPLTVSTDSAKLGTDTTGST